MTTDHETLRQFILDPYPKSLEKRTKALCALSRLFGEKKRRDDLAEQQSKILET
jgi:hypothetical protein